MSRPQGATQQDQGDLIRDTGREAYRAQLRKWCGLADVRQTPERMEAIRADQARLIAAMGRK